jgi:DNA-binding CsgD family transcriptional regulator
MTTNERRFIAAVLLFIVVMAIFDLMGDFQDGVSWWHIAIEGSTATAALAGVYLMLRGAFTLKHSLAAEKVTSSALKSEAQMWRSQYKKVFLGLSQAIDTQLTSWKLTSSEKEVAFLLLKGLSLKEIATVRKTAEKTARAQSIAVYAKAGLSGRSELAAFFLEDLFLPFKSDESSPAANAVDSL